VSKINVQQIGPKAVLKMINKKTIKMKNESGEGIDKLSYSQLRELITKRFFHSLTEKQRLMVRKSINLAKISSELGKGTVEEFIEAKLGTKRFLLNAFKKKTKL
jgi:hypothetical protein